MVVENNSNHDSEFNQNPDFFEKVLLLMKKLEGAVTPNAIRPFIINVDDIDPRFLPASEVSLAKDTNEFEEKHNLNSNQEEILIPNINLNSLSYIGKEGQISKVEREMPQNPGPEQGGVIIINKANQNNKRKKLYFGYDKNLGKLRGVSNAASQRYEGPINYLEVDNEGNILSISFPSEASKDWFWKHFKGEEIDKNKRQDIRDLQNAYFNALAVSDNLQEEGDKFSTKLDKFFQEREWPQDLIEVLKEQLFYVNYDFETAAPIIHSWIDGTKAEFKDNPSEFKEFLYDLDLAGIIRIQFDKEKGDLSYTIEKKECILIGYTSKNLKTGELEVSSFRRRVKNPKKGSPKYLSSPKNYSVINDVPPEDQLYGLAQLKGQVIVISEGEITIDGHTLSISEMPGVSIPGITQMTDKLIKSLKDSGVEKIYICMDYDPVGKGMSRTDGVTDSDRAALNIALNCEKLGMDAKIITLPNIFQGNKVGIDDLILSDEGNAGLDAYKKALNSPLAIAEYAEIKGINLELNDINNLYQSFRRSIEKYNIAKDRGGKILPDETVEEITNTLAELEELRSAKFAELYLGRKNYNQSYYKNEQVGASNKFCEENIYFVNEDGEFIQPDKFTHNIGVISLMPGNTPTTEPGRFNKGEIKTNPLNNGTIRSMQRVQGVNLSDMHSFLRGEEINNERFNQILENGMKRLSVESRDELIENPRKFSAVISAGYLHENYSEDSFQFDFGIKVLRDEGDHIEKLTELPLVIRSKQYSESVVAVVSMPVLGKSRGERPIQNALIESNLVFNRLADAIRPSYGRSSILAKRSQVIDKFTDLGSKEFYANEAKGLIVDNMFEGAGLSDSLFKLRNKNPENLVKGLIRSGNGIDAIEQGLLKPNLYSSGIDGEIGSEEDLLNILNATEQGIIDQKINNIIIPTNKLRDEISNLKLINERIDVMVSVLLDLKDANKPSFLEGFKDGVIQSIPNIDLIMEKLEPWYKKIDKFESLGISQAVVEQNNLVILSPEEMKGFINKGLAGLRRQAEMMGIIKINENGFFVPRFEGDVIFAPMLNDGENKAIMAMPLDKVDANKFVDTRNSFHVLNGRGHEHIEAFKTSEQFFNQQDLKKLSGKPLIVTYDTLDAMILKNNSYNQESNVISLNGNINLSEAQIQKIVERNPSEINFVFTGKEPKSKLDEFSYGGIPGYILELKNVSNTINSHPLANNIKINVISSDELSTNLDNSDFIVQKVISESIPLDTYLEGVNYKEHSNLQRLSEAFIENFDKFIAHIELYPSVNRANDEFLVPDNEKMKLKKTLVGKVTNSYSDLKNLLESDKYNIEMPDLAAFLDAKLGLGNKTLLQIDEIAKQSLDGKVFKVRPVFDFDKMQIDNAPTFTNINSSREYNPFINNLLDDLPYEAKKSLDKGLRKPSLSYKGSKEFDREKPIEILQHYFKKLGEKDDKLLRPKILARSETGVVVGQKQNFDGNVYLIESSAKSVRVANNRYYQKLLDEIEKDLELNKPRSFKEVKSKMNIVDSRLLLLNKISNKIDSFKTLMEQEKDGLSNQRGLQEIIQQSLEEAGCKIECKVKKANIVTIPASLNKDGRKSIRNFRAEIIVSIPADSILNGTGRDLQFKFLSPQAPINNAIYNAYSKATDSLLQQVESVKDSFMPSVKI